jgi:hypothetical protein
MDIHSYMLFVGRGDEESENRSALTVSADKIVRTDRGLTLHGPDGKLFAKVILEPTTKIRIVGE